MRHRQSHITLGPRLNLRSTPYANPLSPNHPVVLAAWQAGARLAIGSDFAMTGGSLVSTTSIVIGDRVNIGANSTVTDTDFHPLNPEQRLLHPQDARAAPIVIEGNVFIGMNCLILKGVTPSVLVTWWAPARAGRVAVGDADPRDAKHIGQPGHRTPRPPIARDAGNGADEEHIRRAQVLQLGRQRRPGAAYQHLPGPLQWFKPHGAFCEYNGMGR
jgi:hypothetical protein